MFHEVPARAQLEAARTDPLRILVVGAGVAGVTLAQLLRRAGCHPVLVERRRELADQGYMLALMPMVDAVLDDLGVRDDYRARSQGFDRYRVLGRRGRTLRTDPIAGILDRYGDYRGIGRGELLDCLAGAACGCPVTLGTRVTAIERDGRSAESRRGHGAAPLRVTLTGAQVAECEVDLVVAADGLGSATRELLLGADDTAGAAESGVTRVDTGWGGWVVWADEDDDPGLGTELWGNGFFVGAYPVRGALGAFLGGPTGIREAGPTAYVEHVRSALRETSPRIDRVLEALRDDPDPYWWPLADVRAPRWWGPGFVLLGDAAAGFLPTAGIGAGMAMESAWVLARLLAGARAGDLPARLAAYERAQRPRVEAAQDTSRRLASLMCRTNLPLAIARDLAMRFVSIEVALGPIRRLLADPPRPQEILAGLGGTSGPGGSGGSGGSGESGGG